MSPPSSSEVTVLLERWRRGEAEAFEELLPHVYEELRSLAANRLRAERAGHTLQTTALVHEAYLRLVGKRRAQIKDRSHFFAIAAQAMRRVLIDHARRQRAAKRGDGQAAVPLDAVENLIPGQVLAQSEDLMALEAALNDLTKLDPRQAQVVELRYFGGLTVAEASEVMAVSEATVNREWRVAKLWLRRQIRGTRLEHET